jgi:hypothetical protein
MQSMKIRTQFAREVKDNTEIYSSSHLLDEADIVDVGHGQICIRAVTPTFCSVSIGTRGQLIEFEGFGCRFIRLLRSA